MVTFAGKYNIFRCLNEKPRRERQGVCN